MKLSSLARAAARGSVAAAACAPPRRVRLLFGLRFRGQEVLSAGRAGTLIGRCAAATALSGFELGSQRREGANRVVGFRDHAPGPD